MSDVIDLTRDDSDTMLNEEEQQKRAIMAFATRVNLGRGLALSTKRTRTDNRNDEDILIPYQKLPRHLGCSISSSAQSPKQLEQVPMVCLRAENALLASLHAERRAREQLQGKPSTFDAGTRTSNSSPTVSVLSFNLWFKEEVHLKERMDGFATVLQRCGHPTYLLLQEVTHNMIRLFEQSDWWQKYEHSPIPQGRPYFTLLAIRRDTAKQESGFANHEFRNSVMARGLLQVQTEVHWCPLLVATSHLESPLDKANLYVQQRQQQQKEAVSLLQDTCQPDVIYAGDMNWEQDRDGSPWLPAGWQDAWSTLRPGEAGYTWDPRHNPMIASNWPGKRLDRVWCKLSHWQLTSIDLIGTEAIPGLTYVHEKTQRRLPVLISDHFGILVTLALVQGKTTSSRLAGLQ